MSALFLRLSIKAIKRDFKSGELRLLALALIIAVACVSSMSILSHTINQQIAKQASNVLGADYLLTSPIAIKESWQAKASQERLNQTMTLSFLSMVQANGQLQLSLVKAVKNNYPLKGDLLVADELFGTAVKAHSIVEPGSVWLASRLFPLLKVSIGDHLELGEASFKVTGVIVEEPGQMGDWFNIAPKIMMNWQDIAKTQVVQAGSRLNYRWLLSGLPAQLTAMTDWLKPKLNEQQKLIDSQNSSKTISKAIQRTLDYLNLGTLMSLILACIAVSMASIRYSQRHTKQVALLRCFGASQRQIILLYLTSLLILGAVACLLGVSIGYAMQPTLLLWLKGLLPTLEVSFVIWPAVMSWLTGMMVLLFFSMSHVISLAKIPAVTLLRSQDFYQQSNAMNYSLALFLLMALSYVYTQSIAITQGVIFGCLLFIGLVFAIMTLITKVLLMRKSKLKLNWRFGLMNISRNKLNSALQIIGIGLASTCLLSLYLLQTSLFNQWRSQLPKKAPNYFVININPEQVGQLQKILGDANIETSEIYPMVRGRIVKINNKTPQQLLGDKAPTIRSLQRELNLSWSWNVPPENKTVQGEWLSKQSSDNWVSIEKGVAERIGLNFGDTVTFRIAGRLVTAKVANIRQVNWSNFKPNFFMLFKPGFLDDLPKTYITSFHLSPNQKSVLNHLVKSLPNITIIDVASLINKVQTILKTSTKVINTMMIFSLLVGSIIMILAMLAFSAVKQVEINLLKSLGMSRRQLLLIQSSESIIIGLIAGFIAVVIAVLLNMYLSYAVLSIDAKVPWGWFISMPVTLSLITSVVHTIVMRSQYDGRVKFLTSN